MGLPVVATDMGGTREAMDPEVTGLLVPAKDVEGLIGALGQLVSDPARRLTMGATARTWLRSTFTLETMIAQVSGVYDEALAAYRGAP